jgi:hypothetical protein
MRGVNRDPDERFQPDGAAPDEFEAIVAEWRREGKVPQWPDDPESVDRSADGVPGEPGGGLFEPTVGTHREPPGEPPPRDAAPAERSSADAVPVDDDHFVPPEPPPLPRINPPAMVGLVLIGLGLALLAVPGWIVPEPYGMPLGLVGLASGLGWLVLRLWPDPPSRGGDGDDDGAVV